MRVGEHRAVHGGLGSDSGTHFFVYFSLLFCPFLFLQRPGYVMGGEPIDYSPSNKTYYGVLKVLQEVQQISVDDLYWTGSKGSFEESKRYAIIQIQVLGIKEN